MIGVFLSSEAYQAFKAAERCNRRVEEAFDALERALQDALPPVEWETKSVVSEVP